jgi:DNA (cytosine-5)-methyltransferase 1
MGTLTFADLCAGSGGFRLGLERLGWDCRFACEIDRACEVAYAANFGEPFAHHDLLTLDPARLPAVDALCAGFPCQPYSIAGQRRGFADPRSRVFPALVALARATQPAALILENVPHLRSHDGGATLARMLADLDAAGYVTFTAVLDAARFGVPQQRRRLFLVAFRRDLDIAGFAFPRPQTPPTPFRPFLVPGDGPPISPRWRAYLDLYAGRKCLADIPFPVPRTRVNLERATPGVDLDDCILQYRTSGVRALSLDQPQPTFAVSVSGGGAMVPIYTKESRHLGLVEMRRLMGFPDDFALPAP